jgi:hypothetical protein
MNQMDNGQVTFFPERPRRKARRKAGLSSHGQRIADIGLRKGYLLGLEDGYVQGKIVAADEQNDEKYSGMDEFDELFKEAHKLVDEKGEQYYQEYVEGVNYYANGKRSRGFVHQGPCYDRHGRLAPWEVRHSKEQECTPKTT